MVVNIASRSATALDEGVRRDSRAVAEMAYADARDIQLGFHLSKTAYDGFRWIVWRRRPLPKPVLAALHRDGAEVGEGSADINPNEPLCHSQLLDRKVRDVSLSLACAYD